jgi:hypothetical protein
MDETSILTPRFRLTRPFSPGKRWQMAACALRAAIDSWEYL